MSQTQTTSSPSLNLPYIRNAILGLGFTLAMSIATALPEIPGNDKPEDEEAQLGWAQETILVHFNGPNQEQIANLLLEKGVIKADSMCLKAEEPVVPVASEHEEEQVKRPRPLSSFFVFFGLLSDPHPETSTIENIQRMRGVLNQFAGYCDGSIEMPKVPMAVRNEKREIIGWEDVPLLSEVTRSQMAGSIANYGARFVRAHCDVLLRNMPDVSNLRIDPALSAERKIIAAQAILEAYPEDTGIPVLDNFRKFCGGVIRSSERNDKYSFGGKGEGSGKGASSDRRARLAERAYADREHTKATKGSTSEVPFRK